MDPVVTREIARGFVALAGMHHLALLVIFVVVWARRNVAARLLSWYFALAFATASLSLFSRTETRVAALVSAALAALWVSEAVRARLRLSFARTPRPRLVLMALAGAFAASYPGHSGGLPPFIFSPLGVTLQPTLLAAIALLNASSEPADRALHWSLAVAGLVVGSVGLAVEGWISLPLVVAAAYAVPLLMGSGRLRPEVGDRGATSVRQIRDRMYSRRSLLPGPRDARRPGRAIRIRRRR
ncbi:MAG: hypothetical protein ABIG03_04105 [Candidatus Eisenbacteria bacterium]